MRSSRDGLVALAVTIALTCGLGVAAAEVRSPGPAPPAPPAAALVAPVATDSVPLTTALAGAGAGRLPAPALSPAAPVPVPDADERRAPRLRVPRAPRAPKACPPAPAVPRTRSTRARVVGSSIAVYSSPGAAKPARTMSNPREEDGLPLDFLVRARRGEWLKVQLPVRPNFTHGWVRVRDVELSGLPYRILVERCAHRMTLFKDGAVVMREVVAVGKPQYPTPVGEFYVDYIYPFSMRSGYGPWLLSIAGFSDVLQSFGGGRGQLALHGTSARWSLGRDASHGCVRLSPEASTRLAELVKPGTPVSIVA